VVSLGDAAETMFSLIPVKSVLNHLNGTVPVMGVVLQGRLGPFAVADIFQFLALAQKTGQLIIETMDDIAWIYFHKGDLIYARRRGPTERLGDRLLRLDLVTKSQLAGASLRAGLAPQKKRIGQILLEAGSLDQASLQKVVRDQIREAVAEIIAYKRGDFRFFEDRLPHGEDILLDVSLDLLLLEGLKKLDELGHNSPGDPDASSGG
jgi:hypothetical protein